LCGAAIRETLKHEKYTYLGKAAPYANVADPHARLAERIEPSSPRNTPMAAWRTATN
jgi:hypothetical protein